MSKLFYPNLHFSWKHILHLFRASSFPLKLFTQPPLALCRVRQRRCHHRWRLFRCIWRLLRRKWRLLRRKWRLLGRKWRKLCRYFLWTTVLEVVEGLHVVERRVDVELDGAVGFLSHLLDLETRHAGNATLWNSKNKISLKFNYWSDNNLKVSCWFWKFTMMKRLSINESVNFKLKLE